MMRIGLFLLTNLAVLALASVTLNLLGFNSIMAQNGVDLNLSALLVFCAVFGMSGSLISLFMSKWMAKRSTGTQLITEPRTEGERWLVQTVAQLAEQEGIGMPEVGVFPSEASNAFATGWNRNAALVAVSSGLLARFDRNEIRAVLAHEIGHVLLRTHRHAKHGTLDHAVGHIRPDIHTRLHLGPESALVHTNQSHPDNITAQHTHSTENSGQHRHGNHTRKEARRQYPTHGIDRHHLHGTQLLSGFHQTDLSRQRRTGTAGKQQGGDNRSQFTNQGQGD